MPEQSGAFSLEVLFGLCTVRGCVAPDRQLHKGGWVGNEHCKCMKRSQMNDDGTGCVTVPNDHLHSYLHECTYSCLYNCDIHLTSEITNRINNMTG